MAKHVNQGKSRQASDSRRRARLKNSKATSAMVSFINFVRKQGVVGLAVGLAIGTQAGATVKSIVEEFINPIVGFILGGVSLEKLSWNTGLKNNGVELVIGWGAILSALITLIAVAAVIYFVVIGLKLDKLDKPKE